MAIAAVLVVLQTGPGRSALSAVGLARGGASFAELSFLDPADLPTALPGSHLLDLRFAVTSVGSPRRSYGWAVAEERPTSVTLASGVTAARGTTSVAQTVRVPCHGARAEIAVTLTGSAAKITLWLSCPGAG